MCVGWGDEVGSGWDGGVAGSQDSNVDSDLKMWKPKVLICHMFPVTVLFVMNGAPSWNVVSSSLHKSMLLGSD